MSANRHTADGIPIDTTDLTATDSQIGNATQVTSSPHATVNQITNHPRTSPLSFALGQLAQTMLGPAAGEIGEMWGDQVRAYRYERQRKCVVKAEKMAKDAGFTPQAVPIKLLFPLLEGASMEEDEDLHTMWAALLANASANKPRLVRPVFISLLRDMAPDEAELLSAIANLRVRYRELMEMRRETGSSGRNSGKTARLQIELRTALRNNLIKLAGEDEVAASTRFEACTEALERAGLVRGGYSEFEITSLGDLFMQACRPPNAK